WPKGVAKMAATVRQIKGAGLAAGTPTRDRTRTVGSRARSIAANLRRRTEQAKDEVRAINADLVTVAEQAVGEALAVVRNARRKLRQSGAGTSGRTRAAVEQLQRTAQRVARVAEQTRQRLAGVTPDGATRLVSLHDPDARPIAKGRLGKPVEFGYKAQVVDNEDGVVIDHTVEAGNPPDAPMLVPAVERIRRRAGKPPRAVTADRGYGQAAVESPNSR
ncbi:MAG: transposase, partial [Actinomycetota bacterium]|nr:transposase [Actinomycetota bacterium]